MSQNRATHNAALAAIKNICAVGAGAMGSMTALCFAMGGYTVRLYDLTDEAVAAGLKNIRAGLDSYVVRGLLNAADVPTIMARITTSTVLEEAAKDADFVIESIVENLAIKQKVWAQLDTICPPHTIFGTNTSGLSPTAIAEAITRKDKFVVTHFWNPPHLLPLVEVVPGQHTAPATVDTACALMTKIGKKAVPLQRESLGFVGNRLQLALLREALYIVESGIATAEDVDAVVEYSLGRRLATTGPIKSADLGGLDVFKNIFSYLGADLCSSAATPGMLSRAVEAGNLGAKTGQGMYAWQAEALEALKDARVDELFRHLQKDMEQTTANKKISGAA